MQEDKNCLLLPKIELKIFGRKVRSVYWLRYHDSTMLAGWGGVGWGGWGQEIGENITVMTVITFVALRLQKFKHYYAFCMVLLNSLKQ